VIAVMDGKASLINLDLIVAGSNDREVFREAEIRELAESIETVGLLQPITVRPVGDGYEIVAGERRFRAHRLLGRAFIPAQVRDLTDEQASQIMAVACDRPRPAWTPAGRLGASHQPVDAPRAGR